MRLPSITATALVVAACTSNSTQVDLERKDCLVNPSEQWQRLSDAGKRTVEHQFSVDCVRHILEDIGRQVMRQRQEVRGERADSEQP